MQCWLTVSIVVCFVLFRFVLFLIEKTTFIEKKKEKVFKHRHTKKQSPLKRGTLLQKGPPTMQKNAYGVVTIGLQN